MILHVFLFTWSINMLFFSSEYEKIIMGAGNKRKFDLEGNECINVIFFNVPKRRKWFRKIEFSFALK